MRGEFLAVIDNAGYGKKAPGNKAKSDAPRMNSGERREKIKSANTGEEICRKRTQGNTRSRAG
jgi:hypothetical protein